MPHKWHNRYNYATGVYHNVKFSVHNFYLPVQKWGYERKGAGTQTVRIIPPKNLPGGEIFEICVKPIIRSEHECSVIGVSFYLLAIKCSLRSHFIMLSTSHFIMHAKVAQHIRRARHQCLALLT